MNRSLEMGNGQKLCRVGTPCPPSVTTRATVQKQPLGGHGVPTLPGFVPRVFFVNLECAVRSRIPFFATLLFSAFVVGCASNPAEFRDEIKTAKSITIVCCDTTAAVSVQSSAGMVLGGGGGLLGAAVSRGAILGSQDSRTNEFYRNAGGPPLPLPADFLKSLEKALTDQGYSVFTEYPKNFDGYKNTYGLDHAKVKTQLILEVRYAGQIAEYNKRFFPTLAASFAVRRATDNKALNFGYVATSDPGVTSPLGISLGVEILRAPILSSISTLGAVQFAHLIQLSESQTVPGVDSDLMNNARRLYDGTESANRDMAKLLASRISEPLRGK